jgi:hypothetical protein
VLQRAVHDDAHLLVSYQHVAPAPRHSSCWAVSIQVDGLGHGGSDAETDFAAVVYQLRLLGYNMVRLPFRYRDLDHPYPKDYVRTSMQLL